MPAVVEPKDAAADQEQQREDRQLTARDLPLTTISVVPGEHKDNRQSDQECDDRYLAQLFWPMEGLADVLEALQEPPRSGDVNKAPLHNLAAAQRAPPARGPALYRRVRHSTAPMEQQCSGPGDALGLFRDQFEAVAGRSALETWELGNLET